ncbi:response regulator [Litorisediminicola beolgyonensis]|uniref:Response regulator n=1 Tax=Litorisediminicola beolgyonensis TaxID=1173614 RepID=A0ABW3ZF89_9RHOB
MIRVLNLDDDQDLLDIINLSLMVAGRFELIQCQSGPEAIAAAPDFAPDILLLDVMVPGMSGPEVLQAIRALPGLGSVPAIFLTASVQRDEVEGFLEHGASAVIPKPFDPMTLGTQIEAVLQKDRMRLSA